jgi:hypothetical protein
MYQPTTYFPFCTSIPTQFCGATQPWCCYWAQQAAAPAFVAGQLAMLCGPLTIITNGTGGFCCSWGPECRPVCDPRCFQGGPAAPGTAPGPYVLCAGVLTIWTAGTGGFCCSWSYECRPVCGQQPTWQQQNAGQGGGDATKGTPTGAAAPPPPQAPPSQHADPGSRPGAGAAGAADAGQSGQTYCGLPPTPAWFLTGPVWCPTWIPVNCAAPPAQAH